MNENSQTQTCSHCDATVAPGALKGLCPRCLMALNLATQTEVSGDEVGPTGTQVVKPPPAPAPSPEEIARNFPQLEILECLGRGGMGVVYKARQLRLDRLVALKILTRDREDATRDARFAERFEREARALAKLSHPNIVAMYEFGQAEGRPYFIMEYVDGLNLRQLEQAGKLAPREALQIIPQICEALQFAHDEGIVHRDIKPENILLDKKGRVKIADFGIAKILAPGAQDFTLTGGKDVVGTPHYMAPEQVEKPRTVDHRADIYSLGVVFYEMLTGELPLGKFAAPSQKVQVDVRLDEVVLHALEKEPERRYQHASDVKSAVETIAATPPPAADEPNLAEARGRVKAPGLGLCFIGAANTLFAVGLLLWLALGALGASQQPGAFEHTDLKNTLLKLGFVTVPLLLVALVLGVFVVAGGLYMRRLQQYRLAVAASILAVFSPLGVLGLPISIWSMIVLMDPKVREAFATTKRGKADRRTEITPRLDPAQASQPRQEGWKAQLAVVGVRDGKRVVNWWRVATSSSLMVILFNTGALLSHFLSGHPIWSPFTLSVLLVLISATMSLAIYIGLRKQPIERLVRLDEGWPGRGTGAGLRLSRTAVAGAVMAALSFLLPGLLYLRMQASIPDAATARPLLWYLAGLLACATTMVGEVGVTQIRRSAGRVYGLGLALFDALVFPLLALDALIGWVLHLVVRVFTDRPPDAAPILLATILLSAAVDFLIARRAWRAVNTPLDGMVPPSMPPKAGPPPRKGVGLLALALCLVGLALVLPLGWLRAHFESEEFLKLLSMITEQRQTPSGVGFVLSPLFAILMCAFLYGCEIPALVLGLIARRGRAGKIAAFLAGAAILLPFGYFSWEWKETRRVLQIIAHRGIDPTPKLLDVGYEQAIASGPDLSVRVGPNRFVMKAVVRNDRGGALRFEDGRGNTLTTLDFKTNPQLVKQAEWLDLVNLSFGVDSSDPQAELLYDLIEVRVFDHQSRKLLGNGEDRWGVGWDLQGGGLLQLRGAGQPLPDTVDVWFRAASHDNTSGRIQLRPEAGAWTNVNNGRLTVREVRDGQWGYSLGGPIAWSNNPIRSPGCTVVLDWTGDGSLGRQQITVTDTAANQRQVFPPGAPHFLDFQRNGATQIIHFDVPLARVGQVELRPFGGRHTFYFDGVNLPKVSQRRLTLPPPLVLPLNGQAATVESQELDPVKVRITTLGGRTETTSDFPLRDPALDATRYLAVCGPAVQTNAFTTVLWRVEGLGRVPVGLTFLDHQGQRLNPGRPHQKAELSGVGPLATASAWAFAMPLAQAHTVLVQLGTAADHESTAPAKLRYKLVQRGEGAGKQSLQIEPIEKASSAQPLAGRGAMTFGPEGKGLRAAVELISSNGVFALGEPIEVLFHIRNTSSTNIYVAGGSWRQDEAPHITIEDQQGRQIPAQHIYYSVRTPIQRNLLLPGETAVFHSSGLAFLAKDADGKQVIQPVGNYVKVAPGRYTVRYRLHFPDLEQTGFPQSSDWQGDLDTAPVTVEITAANKSAAAPAFGPVIERALDFDITLKTAYLDLDTGEYVDPVWKAVTQSDAAISAVLRDAFKAWDTGSAHQTDVPGAR